MTEPGDIIDALYRPKPPAGMTRPEWDAVIFSLLHATRAKDLHTIARLSQVIASKLGTTTNELFWRFLVEIMFGGGEQFPTFKDPDLTRDEFNAITRTVSDLLLLEFAFHGSTDSSETSHE